MLGDPTRRAIFELLSERPSSVGDLAALVPVSRPAVSQHLKVLKDAGLLMDERDGTRRIYRLDPDGVAEMRAYLDRFWNLAMAGFKRTGGATTKGNEMSMSVSAPVELSIDVEASIEEAFEVFTQDMGSWWPADHHILQAELAEMVFEPKVGGQILDRGVDGSECRWARVLVYDPPNRVVFTWDISLAWQVETDPAKTSEVDVRFTPVAPDRTRVDLVHRNIERHGEGWEQMHGAVESPEGWAVGLGRFARRMATGSADIRRSDADGRRAGCPRALRAPARPMRMPVR